MRRFLWAAAAVMSAACSDTAAPQSDKIDPVGTYSLQSINDKALPFILIEISQSYSLYQTWGTLTLNANKTFIERDSVREVIVQSPSAQVRDTMVTITGTWLAEDDSVITLTQSNGGFLFGAARKMTMTLTYLASDNSAYTYLYLKK